MKKIPKFDMKAWSEKQEKVAKEANGGGNPLSGKQSFTLSKPSDYSGIINFIPKNELIPQYPTGHLPYNIIPTEPPDLRGYLPKPIDQMKVWNDWYYKANSVGDPFDKYLFGGDEDPQLTLPKGHSDDSWFNLYPQGTEKKQDVHVCSEETLVNIGFHNDKWVCKVCDKEKS